MRLGYINIFSGTVLNIDILWIKAIPAPTPSLRSTLAASPQKWQIPPPLAPQFVRIYPKGLLAPNKGAHPQILETTWHSPNTTTSTSSSST